MDLEGIIWIYLPMIIAILEVYFSVKSIKLKRSVVGIASFVLILLINLFAVSALISMLIGAWPSFIPHILIGFSAIFLIIQLGLADRNKRRETFANPKK